MLKESILKNIDNILDLEKRNIMNINSLNDFKDYNKINNEHLKNYKNMLFNSYFYNLKETNYIFCLIMQIKINLEMEKRLKLFKKIIERNNKQEIKQFKNDFNLDNLKKQLVNYGENYLL